MDPKDMTDKEFLEFVEEKLTSSYDDIGPYYHRFLKIIGFNKSKHIADHFKEFKIPKEASILDCGCGTGRAVEVIHEMGYLNKQGFEPSQGMINEAKKTGYYTKILQGALTVPEEMPKEYENAFDVITCQGVFMIGHLIKPEAYECLLFACKKGGLMIFTTDEFDKTPEELKYREKRDAMVKEGKWELLKEFEFEKYLNLDPSVVTDGRYSQKRADTLFVYRKL